MSKKHSSAGFTFIEVSIAMLILFSAISTFIPIVTKIYMERMTIQEHYQALNWLNMQLFAWRFEHVTAFDSTLTMNETVYELQSFYRGENELTLCLTWIGRNQRSYEQCAFAKK